jgi:hypothetical protein
MPLLVLLAGCGKAPEALPADAIAVVGDSVITEEAFRYWWERKEIGRDTSKGREKLLDDLIDRYARVEQARKAGLHEDQEVLEQINSLLIARLREKELEPKVAEVSVSDDQVRSYYEIHKETEFTSHERFHIAVLWFETRGQKPLEMMYRPRLEEISIHSQSVALEEGFGAFASKNTEHRASRYKRGDIGWLRAGGDYDPWRRAVLNIAASLQPGETSEVVSNNLGVFLVRLIDHQPASVRDFESVEQRIHEKLLVKRRAEIRECFDEQILQGIEVKEDPNALAAVRDLSGGQEQVQTVAAITGKMER